MVDRKITKLATAVVGLGLLLALAACGAVSTPNQVGGGGTSSSTSGGNGPPTPDPLAPPQPASTFVDGEFSPCITISGAEHCDNGKGIVGAEYVYAQGAYGSGVVIAVVDSGISPTHPELNANISPDSIDIVSPTLPLSDEMGHGTMVAGVAAGERNGYGMHGVAFDATILAVRADARNPDGSSTGYFTVPDITAGIEYATGRAHVINLSLGIPGTQLDDPFGTPEQEAAFEQALIDAMAGDAIVVAATGNESAAEASLPAAYAGDTTVNASGQMIAVGAVNTAGDALADFSNQCGQAMDYCLVAPGEGIVTSYLGNNLALVDGTSFAAPYVAGSAALLIQLWPTLAPADVVDILLTTATDMGDVGVDAVYGHGLLNLNQAIQPVGTLSIPTGSSAAGAAVPLNGTVLSLGPAFGDALNNEPLLAQTFALDSYDRNYVAGLDHHVIHAERGFGLGALIDDGNIEPVQAVLPNGATVTMAVADADAALRPEQWAGMAADAEPEQKLHGMNMALAGRNGAAYRLGYDVSPGQHLPDTTGAAANLFWMAGDLLGPQRSLVGAGAALSASRSIGGRSIVNVGLVDESAGPDGSGGDSRIADIVLMHRFGSGGLLTAEFSDVAEQNGFLDSDAAGALAVEGANSRFYVLGARVPLGADVEVLGSYTLGRTDMTADGTSLLSDWSGARADAFGLGIVKRDAFGTGNRIGLLAGQPLRVYDASATLTAPVAYQSEKTVVQESERVRLVPTGREIDLQLAYDQSVGARGSVAGWLMMQLEPGHDADAAPAYGVGLRYRATF